jgi:organic hydroperoxide reductase OsmC/OhrA
MANEHHYELRLLWKGDHTRNYEDYTREHSISIEGKPVIIASADQHFRGDPALLNPEDLLLAALSACHLLTYLALCARARIDVKSYSDQASGTLRLTPDGSGEFTEVVLRPKVFVADQSMVQKAEHFHREVHKYCFIARSVNFPVRCDPEVTVILP